MKTRKLGRSIKCRHSLLGLFAFALVFSVQLSHAQDFKIPITVSGQNVFGVDTMNIIFDSTATAPDSDPDAVDGFDDEFFDFSSIGGGASDTLKFLSGSKELFDDARPTLGAGDAQQFRLNIALGDAAFTVTQAGVAYNDTDSSFGYTAGEDVWFDKNNNGKYDFSDNGDDTDDDPRLNNNGTWSTLNGTIGEVATIFFTDSDTGLDYDTGEAVWLESGFDAGNITFDQTFSGAITNPDSLNVPTHGDAGASAHTIILSWNEADVAAAADAAAAGGLAKVLYTDIDGVAQELDMRGDDTGRNAIVVNASQDVFFVFGSGNLPANVTGIESRIVTGSANPLSIDPFADATTIVDADSAAGENVSLVSLTASGATIIPSDAAIGTPFGGTVKFSDDGNSFVYTAPTDGYASDPFDKSTWDSFTYIVNDNDQDTPLPSTGKVEILVLSNQVVAVRSHADRAKAGAADADSGLEVTVTITLGSGVDDLLSKLELDESFPSKDNDLVSEGWSLIVTDGGVRDNDVASYDIGGTNPPDTIVDNVSDVKFSWSAAALLALPANTTELSFTYRITGHIDDRLEKTMEGGLITYNLTASAAGADEAPFNLVDTTFLPVDKLFHAADYKGDNGAGDFKIDSDELFDVIVLFNAGEYRIDSTRASGFGPGAGNQSGLPHSADYKGGPGGAPDFKIDSDELFDVIVLFNAGLYHASDTRASGYAPGPDPAAR